MSCIRPPIKQVSTGQAGPEVNRDLELLFERVNDLQTCITAIVKWITSQTGGGFAEGAGSTSAPGIVNPDPNTEPGGDGGWDGFSISTGSNYTIPEGQGGVIYITPTANIDVTLPPGATATRPIMIQHSGAANTITLKTDGGTTIETLTAGAYVTAMVMENSSNVRVWATGALVFFPGGTMYATSDMSFGVAGAGPVIMSPNLTRWRIEVTNAGALSTVSLGGGAITDPVP